MTAPHGNFDDVLAEALAAAGIVDSRRQVRDRITHLRVHRGGDYYDVRIKRMIQDEAIEKIKPRSELIQRLYGKRLHESP